MGGAGYAAALWPGVCFRNKSFIQVSSMLLLVHLLELISIYKIKKTFKIGLFI